MSAFSHNFPPATSLYRRRLLRNFANWGFFGLASVLALIAYLADVPLFVNLLFVGATLAAVVIDDIRSPTSLLMRIGYWLRYERPGAAVIPQVGTGQTDLYWCTPLGKSSGERLSDKRYRWQLFAWLVLVGWAFGSFLGFEPPAEEEMVLWRAVLVILVFGSTAIPYGMLVAAAMARFRWGKGFIVWLALSTIGPTLLGGALWQITADQGLSALASVLIYGIYLFAYLSQRLWMGERAYDRVIQELILNFLSSNDGWASLTHDVPRLIGKQMSYRRVFILRTEDDREHLEIVGQYGDYEDVLGKRFSATEGITGRAYKLKKTLLWNDTRRCPFYLDVTGPDHVDDTRSEIAIPIRYRDEVYGVLDVQSDAVGVFSAADTEWLDVIALLLGAVLAAAKSDVLITAALKSWDQLSSGGLASEGAVFSQFAEAAIDTVRAKALVFYPLSPARYPARPPLSSGDEEIVQRGLSSWEPLLMRLIEQWEPSLAANGMSCVIPVGTARERFGLLAWHFDTPYRIDSLLELTLRTLSQGFTTAIALARYREIFFDGFGRPELGIHSLLGRHGLKVNDALQANMVQVFDQQTQCAAARGGKIENCAIFPIVAKTNMVINDLISVEATLPPNFWRTTLQERLQALKSSQLKAPHVRVPAIELSVDELIERESPWLRLAIYRLSVEAIDNAMHHGHATRISLHVKRTAETVDVCIRNNGEPIEPDAKEKRISARGIYSQLARFRERYDATVSGPAQEGGFVVICVSIPCLPLRLEET